MFGVIMPLCNRMFCCIFGWYFYIELRLKCEKKIIVYPYGAAVIWLKNWNQRQQWKENYIQAYGAAVRILKILVKMIRIRIQKLFITKCETCSSQVECDQEIDWWGMKGGPDFMHFMQLFVPKLQMVRRLISRNCNILLSFQTTNYVCFFACLDLRLGVGRWPTIDLYQENSRWKKWI